jgi:hypothetical protein
MQEVRRTSDLFDLVAFATMQSFEGDIRPATKHNTVVFNEFKSSSGKGRASKKHVHRVCGCVE